MFLTTQQAADRLGLSLRRTQALIKARNPERRLPATRIGRDWVVDADDIEPFLRRVRPNGRPPMRDAK